VDTKITIMVLVAFLAMASHGEDARAKRPVPDSAQDIRPLLVGAPVPRAILQTPAGKPFALAKAVHDTPTVLIFYRGGWCPYCNAHLGQLQTIEPDLVKLGYQMLAVSPDRPEMLAGIIPKDKLSYALLSDASMNVARAFGIAFRVDKTTLEKYKGYGIDLEAASGNTHHLLPVPAVFIIGTDGTVKFTYTNPDYQVRLAPEVLLAAARAEAKRAERAKKD